MSEADAMLSPLGHSVLVTIGGGLLALVVTVGLFLPRVTAIVRREVTAFFTSPVAYVTLCFYALMGGNSLTTGLAEMTRADEPSMAQAFLGFMVATLLVAPVLTMRLVAEERDRGTLEQLLCTAVHPWEVVLGKYLAAMCLYLMLIGLTVVHYLGVVRCLGADMDHGQVLCGYLGLLLFGSGLMAMGLMVSAFCRNAMSAVVITLALFFGLLFLDTGIPRVTAFVERVLVLALPPTAAADLPSTIAARLGEGLQFISLNAHITTFLQGRLEMQDVAYHLSVTCFCLVMVLLAINVRRS